VFKLRSRFATDFGHVVFFLIPPEDGGKYELVEQVHVIAARYHWSYNEIMNLSDPMRLKFFNRILIQIKKEKQDMDSIGKR
jgi:hypothetical protein